MTFVARSLPTPDRDDGRSLPVPRKAAPDFFLSASHDLFAIGALYRSAGEAFNRSLNACSQRNERSLEDALTLLRDRAERIVTLSAMLKVKTEDPDLFENASEAYGERP